MLITKLATNHMFRVTSLVTHYIFHALHCVTTLVNVRHQKVQVLIM
jgi:hypothetical protein